MIERLLAETISEDSPKDRFPIIGFFGFVFISITGAKFICIPSRLSCSPILMPIFLINSSSSIAPNVIFQGYAKTFFNLIAAPHSASIETNKGILEFD